MKRRTRRGLLLTGSVILAVALGVAVWRQPPGPPKEPTTAQIAAKIPAQPARVVIARNAQVSAAHASFDHSEVVVVADPRRPHRLVASAMRSPPGKGLSVACYLSEDGGMSWRPCFARDPGPGERNVADPALAFDPDGGLYLVCIPITATAGGDDQHSFEFHHSPDGGDTWQLTATVRQDADRTFLDRPFLAVDGSAGGYRGRLYCASFGLLSTSADRGRTFAHRPYARKQGVVHDPSPPAVLSDGTLALGHRLWSGDREQRPGFEILLSDDGGRTLREGTPVGTYWYDEGIKTSKFWFVPQLAADTSSAAYRDRLYAVWEDGNAAPVPPGQPDRPGPGRILFARSNDRGRSWVGPTILSEQPADGGGGYGAYMPSLAVNKDGAVAVSWYDRRDLPGADGPRAPFYGPGCNVRLRLSLDGGDTWPPSVQVNEQVIRATVWELRDTAGLAADAAGTFHPAWIDDRTGVRQVWTAAVEIEAE
jgi:hypothetical protein